MVFPEGVDWGDAVRFPVLAALIAASAFLLIPPSGADAVTDTDGDGFDDAVESFVGTLTLEPCARTSDPDDEEPDARPSDFNDDQAVNILDIVQLTPPTFNSAPPDANYSIRKDLTADGVIDIIDIVLLTPPVFNTGCTPLGCTIEPCCNVDADLTICLETDKLIYNPGEPVLMSLHATNTGANPQTFVFNDRCLTTFTVYSGSQQIWSSATGQLCADIIVDVTLNPGETFSDSRIWSQTFDSGGSAPPGDYWVFGLLNAPCGNPPPCGAPFGAPVSRHNIRILPN